MIGGDKIQRKVGKEHHQGTNLSTCIDGLSNGWTLPFVFLEANSAWKVADLFLNKRLGCRHRNKYVRFTRVAS